jgi:hypothetical protein
VVLIRGAVSKEFIFKSLFLSFNLGIGNAHLWLCYEFFVSLG